MGPLEAAQTATLHLDLWNKTVYSSYAPDKGAHLGHGSLIVEQVTEYSKSRIALHRGPAPETRAAAEKEQ
jgi:hypothetical protein